MNVPGLSRYPHLVRRYAAAKKRSAHGHRGCGGKCASSELDLNFAQQVAALDRIANQKKKRP